MDPVTIGYAGLAAFQMLSGFQQAEQIRQNADIKRQIAEMNAKYAELDAYNAEKAGFTHAARYQSTIDATVGAQKTAMASQGVDVHYGTAAAVQNQTRLTGTLNILDIQKQAMAQAYGYKTQATNIRLGGQTAVAQGALDAGSVETTGLLRGFGTAIQGADKYYTDNKNETKTDSANGRRLHASNSGYDFSGEA